MSKGAIFSLTSPVVILRRDENRGKRLSAWQGGKQVWESSWRVNLTQRPSADGRWLAVSSQSPNSKLNPAKMDFSRLDLGTGKASQAVTLVPSTKDPNSIWVMDALSPNGQYALASEGTGDGCGWSIYGFKLLDLKAARLVPMPQSFTQGYNRFGGCARNVPYVQSSFASDGSLLVQDGNRLDWWQLP